MSKKVVRGQVLLFAQTAISAHAGLSVSSVSRMLKGGAKGKT